MASRTFGFPNPVNEKAARTVAAGVAVMAGTVLATGWWWLTPFLALGFALRVAAGPRLSPLGLLATKVVAPRLGPPRLVPGPPKRFAQAVGLLVSISVAVLALGFGQRTAAGVLLAVLLLFALLESVVSFCAGCWIFGHLMRLGLVPEQTCQACNDITLRRQPATAS